jgi:transposase
VKPEVVFRALEDVKKGDTCPECLTGKVYKTDPGNLLRITGQSPFTPEQHVTERFRCNTSGVIATIADGRNIVLFETNYCFRTEFGRDYL